MCSWTMVLNLNYAKDHFEDLMKSAVILQKKEKKERNNTFIRRVMDPLKCFHGPQIRICVLGEGWDGFKAYRHPFVGTMGWCVLCLCLSE